MGRLGTLRTFFEEPGRADDSLPTWDETTVDWLTRSSTRRAAAVREFLNRSLNHFPAAEAQILAKRLQGDWRSHFFEIVVGRYLQVLGAEIQVEPPGSNGTRVDFRAAFTDGTVSVECVSKRYNQAAEQEMALNSKMGVMLDNVGPHDWAISIRGLPKASSPVEFQPYVDEAVRWYGTLPRATDGGPSYRFGCTGGAGPMHLEALPFPAGTHANHLDRAVAYMDDSMLRLKNALIDSHKRRQAQGAWPPVFLAIDCPFNGPDADDFDRALFGHTVDHRAFDLHESAGLSFNPDGLLVTDKDVPFAGVLAVLDLSITGGSDPVVYLNPYQRWKLPAALSGHEQRVWTSRIDRTAATREPVIDSIGFVDLAAAEADD